MTFHIMTFQASSHCVVLLNPRESLAELIIFFLLTRGFEEFELGELDDATGNFVTLTRSPRLMQRLQLLTSAAKSVLLQKRNLL